jgi:hypothetical protein
MLNLFQHLIYFFCFQQTHLSSPSLPTGRQAQGGVSRRDLNKNNKASGISSGRLEEENDGGKDTKYQFRNERQESGPRVSQASGLQLVGQVDHDHAKNHPKNRTHSVWTHGSNVPFSTGGRSSSADCNSSGTCPAGQCMMKPPSMLMA